MNRLQLREAFVKQSGRYNLVGSKTVLGERMPDYTVDDGADRYVDEAIRMLESEVLTTRNLRHYIRTATADFPGVAIPNIIHVKQVAVEDVALKMALESDLMKRLSLETDTGDPTHWIEAHDTTFSPAEEEEEGEEEDTRIPIPDLTTLQKIGFDDDYPLDGDYIQTADIDASATQDMVIGMTPIGLSSAFFGTYDGGGFTISNLYIKSVYDRVGLFSLTSGAAVIKNVHLSLCNITGADYVGGIVGDNGATLEDCTVTGVVSGNDVVGGICGDNCSLIRRLKSSCVVTGNESVGGIVGHNSTRAFRSVDLYATGTVTGTISVGGVSGYEGSPGLSRAYSYAVVSGDSASGGLVGSKSGSATVLYGYYDSDVSGQSDTGKGEPKTTAQLFTQATFVTWDFDSVWEIDDSYPTLRIEAVETEEEEEEEDLDATTILLYPYPEEDTVVHVSCWVHDPLTSDTDSNWWSLHYPYAIVDLAYAILSASELNNDRRIIDQSVERVKMEIYKQDIRDEVAHLGSQII